MINLVNILENTPLGIKLYSPICGECTLEDITSTIISVADNVSSIWDFYADGTYVDCGECLLWPSKEHQTWEGWQEVLFQRGDVITASGGEILLFNSTDYAFTNKAESRVITKSIYRYATSEERDQFFNELNINGYTWNEETKQMEKSLQYTPKFSVGEWIVSNDSNPRDIRKIVAIENNTTYVCQQQDVIVTGGLSIKNIDKYYHKWDLVEDSIQGDILTSDGGSIFMFDGRLLDGGHPGFICALSIDKLGFCTKHNKFVNDNKPWTYYDVQPATCEEIIKLLDAVKERDYTITCDDNGNFDIVCLSDQKKLNDKEKFSKELTEIIHECGIDSNLNIPDHILVDYINNCLDNLKVLGLPSNIHWVQDAKVINS